MTRIENLTGQALTWIQDRNRKRAYELRSDSAIFACLRFERVLGSLATAETAKRKWTFDRKGSLSQRITVRADESPIEVALFSPRLAGGGDVTISGGQRYRWKSMSFWRSEWAFLTDSGAPILTLKLKAQLFTRRAELFITAESPDTEMLALLGWYLMLRMSEDAAAAAALAASTG
jgi:hypothetical protein